MIPGQIVYQGKSKSGKEIIFRYPTEKDLQLLYDYINTLSKEKTYILFQGEQVTLAEEKKYLDTQLQGIREKKAVQLLVFSEGNLVGNTQINLQDKATKHIGAFGISLSKKFRGEGIGTILMGKIIEEAEKKLKGMKIITLECFADNKIAKKLYSNMGFVEFGNLPNGLIHGNRFMDHIFMYKKV